MIYTDEQKKGIIIYSGKVANELLRQGYRITRVMPDKKNKMRTIYIFAVDNNIEYALLKIRSLKPGVSNWHTWL